MAGRWRRPNDLIDIEALCRDLAPHAKLKDPCFDWGILQYGKQRRSQGPDREGLLAYHGLLRVILAHAPGALPGLSALREVWLWLHRQFKIMDPSLIASGKDPNVWAAEAADTIKLMCKHVWDLKVSASPYAPPEVLELINMVVLVRDSPTPSSPAPAPAPAPQPIADRPRTRVLSAIPSIEFCGAFCRCSGCRAKEAPIIVEASQPESQPGSPCSAAAASNSEHVPAKRGSVKAILKKPAAEPVQHKRAAAAKTSVKVVERKNPPEKAEAYVMLGGIYVVGCTRKRDSRYLEHVRLVASELESGALAGKAEAVARFSELLR